MHNVASSLAPVQVCASKPKTLRGGKEGWKLEKEKGRDEKRARQRDIFRHNIKTIAVL